jgi:hypothetical protein
VAFPGVEIGQVGARGLGRKTSSGLIWLVLEIRLAFVFAEQAVHVVVPGADAKPVVPNGKGEAGIVERRAGRTDYIPGGSLVAVCLDVHLFVPVGVELDPALLQAHAAVVLVRAERRAAKVAFHGISLQFARTHLINTF